MLTPDYDSHYFKTNLRYTLTSMNEHRVPRWMTAIWLVFVASLICTSIFAAVQLNSDFVRTIGFLFASSVLICLLSVAGWLAMYGLSVLLEGVEYHKVHCDDSKHWGGMADLIP